MTTRTLLVLGLTLAVGACAKKSQETEGLAPPPAARDTAHISRPDTMRIKGDSIRMQTDSASARRDTTGMAK